MESDNYQITLISGDEANKVEQTVINYFAKIKEVKRKRDLPKPIDRF